MKLPGPDKTYALKISLQLLATVEAAHGSLYLLSARLLDQSLPLSEMIGALKVFYRATGCETEEAALDEFLLRQALHGIADRGAAGDSGAGGAYGAFAGIFIRHDAKVSG